MLGGQPAEVRVVDGVLYLRLPGVTGDGFVRLDPEQTGSLPGEGLGGLGGPSAGAQLPGTWTTRSASTTSSACAGSRWTSAGRRAG